MHWELRVPSFRAAKGILSCVWVVNEHDEEILVVVSGVEIKGYS